MPNEREVEATFDIPTEEAFTRLCKLKHFGDWDISEDVEHIQHTDTYFEVYSANMKPEMRLHKIGWSCRIRFRQGEQPVVTLKIPSSSEHRLNIPGIPADRVEVSGANTIQQWVDIQQILMDEKVMQTGEQLLPIVYVTTERTEQPVQDSSGRLLAKYTLDTWVSSVPESSELSAPRRRLELEAYPGFEEMIPALAEQIRVQCSDDAVPAERTKYQVAVDDVLGLVR